MIFEKRGKFSLKKSFKKSIVDFLNFDKFSFEFKINFCFSRIKFFLEIPPLIFPEFFHKSILKSNFKKIEGGDIPL